MSSVCDKKIEHRSKVKVKVKVKVLIKDMKTTVWTITFEPEIVENSGWFQNVTGRNTYQKYRGPHDEQRTVFASRDVT